MDDNLRRRIEGVAAIGITMCQMGESDNDVLYTMGTKMTELGILTPENARLVAEAIAAFPQPEDDDAYERERRRPIEEWLGVASPENELAAQLRARELALRLVDHIKPT